MNNRLRREPNPIDVISVVGHPIDGDHVRDTLVIACVAAAFIAALMSMGGASTHGTEWPLRWLSAGLALHAHELYHRANRNRARLRLPALLPLVAVAWLWIDAMIHPESAWKAGSASVTAALAAAACWLVAHHARHALHHRMLFGVITLACAAFGALTIGNSNILLAKFSQRVPDAIYANHATGPFGTPGEFCALMLIGFFIAATRTMLPGKSFSVRFVSFYLAALSLVGIFAAATIGGSLGLIVGLTTLGILRFRHKLVRILLLGVGATAAAAAVRSHAGDTGLFRSANDAAPLADAAMNIFAKNPITGVGAGGFANAFESHRPSGWPLDPDGAGGLFHTLLAEHGALGCLCLLLAPALLLGFAWKRLSKLPLTETSYDRQYDISVRFTPAATLSIITTLTVFLAAGAMLAVDYARANVAVLIALAIVGGLTTRELATDAGIRTLAPTGSRTAGRLRIAALAAPAILLPLLSLPILRGEALIGSVRDILAKTAPKHAPAERIIPSEIKLRAFAMAEAQAERALSHMPGNREASWLLAETRLRRHRVDAGPRGLGDALELAAAGAAAPGRPEQTFTYIELLRVHGREAEATSVVDRLLARAPAHAAVRLEYARTHIADSGKQPELTKLLDELVSQRVEEDEARRLLRLIRLSNS